MSFDHLTHWWVSIVLIAAFLFKGFAVAWLLKTDFAEAEVAKGGWVRSVMANSLLNAILTMLILFMFTGLQWAFYFGFADGAIHYLLGYWKKRKHLPTLDFKNLSEVYQIVTFLHSISYVSIVAAVVKYFLPNHVLWK